MQCNAHPQDKGGFLVRHFQGSCLSRLVVDHNQCNYMYIITMVIINSDMDVVVIISSIKHLQCGCLTSLIEMQKTPVFGFDVFGGEKNSSIKPPR